MLDVCKLLCMSNTGGCLMFDSFFRISIKKKISFGWYVFCATLCTYFAYCCSFSGCKTAIQWAIFWCKNKNQSFFRLGDISVQKLMCLVIDPLLYNSAFYSEYIHGDTWHETPLFLSFIDAHAFLAIKHDLKVYSSLHCFCPHFLN